MRTHRRQRYHKTIPVSGYAVGATDSRILEGGAPLAPDHEHPQMDRLRDMIEDWPNGDLREQDMLMARHYEQLSYREIAERFGLGSQETARRRLTKIWATMRERLEQEGFEL